jgi:hypothetical protein
MKDAGNDIATMAEMEFRYVLKPTK